MVSGHLDLDKGLSANLERSSGPWCRCDVGNRDRCCVRRRLGIHPGIWVERDTSKRRVGISLLSFSSFLISAGIYSSLDNVRVLLLSSSPVLALSSYLQQLQIVSRNFWNIKLSGFSFASS